MLSRVVVTGATKGLRDEAPAGSFTLGRGDGDSGW